MKLRCLQPKCDFTAREVKEVILRTRNIKAEDYDGILVVRDGTDILTNTFKAIKNKRDFPPGWKMAIIHLIYKRKGKRVIVSTDL
jgi:hypothetical protein